MDSRGFTRSALLRSWGTRTCFISLPQNWPHFLSHSPLPTFIIESAKSSLTVTWNRATHVCPNGEEEFVYVTGNLITLAGFSEDEMVVVKQIPPPPLCKEVTVKLSSLSEWEELLMNFEEAQDAFLNQIRVVSSNQTIPIWLPGGALVKLTIIELSPSLHCGLLLENTQMKVLSPEEGTNESYSSVLPAKLTGSDFQFDIENRESISEKNDHDPMNILKALYKQFIYSILGFPIDALSLKSCQQDVNLTLRVTMLPSLDLQQTSLKILLKHPTFVMINKKHLNQSRFVDDHFFIAKMKKINPREGKTASKDESKVDNSQEIYVVVLVWPNIVKKLFPHEDSKLFDCFDSILVHNYCILSPSLRRQLSIKNRSIINLSTHNCIFHKDSNNIYSYPKVPVKFSEEVVSTNLKNLLLDLSNLVPIILNSFTLVTFSIENNDFDVILMVQSKQPVMIDQITATMLHVKFIASPLPSLPFVHRSLSELDEVIISKSKNIVNEVTFKEMKDKILHYYNFGFYSSHFRPEFILLVGPKGSGKSFLCKSIMSQISKMPHNIHCEFVKLKKLKGKKLDSIQKTLKETLHRAIFYHPSLLILDDMDFLCSNPSEIDANSSSEYYNHLSLMLKSLLQQLRDEMELRSFSYCEHPSKMNLVMLATTCSMDSLNENISSVHGSHIFSSILSIPPLIDDQRLKFFENLITEFHEGFDTNAQATDFPHETKFSFNYKKVAAAQALNGLNLSDIFVLATRVFMEAKSRSRNILMGSNYSKDFCVIDQDIQSASANFISLSLKALKEPSKNAKKISIGGLSSAHNLLQETIDWPSRYPNLFMQTTLKPRSGILLYGPPGCGKTILVNHVAQNSCLNFISIKGPELLSKYIGQSEKAIRSAFERAQASKPCILFFDEFDSIAPRRGLDNTGVTDRVVNQLLTEMDGVEGLSGVFVLAATSRPDLIDPALLRPGRLDKCVHCPIPSLEEREEILLALSKEVALFEDIDWLSISQLTEGYTGADLQGILSTAQIKAVQEYLGDSLYEGILDTNVHEILDTNVHEILDTNVHEILDTNVHEISDHQDENDSKDLDSRTKNITDDKKSVLQRESKSCREDEHSKTDEEVENPRHADTICLKEKHIYEALREVNPSIKSSDRAFYDRLYETFVGSRENKVFVAISPGKMKTFA